MGVASGAPSDDGFVIWTRLLGLPSAASQPVQVAWQILEDAAPHAVIAQGEVQTSAEIGFSVHVEPSGLQPDRWYRYRFSAGGFQSPTGRTRTLPSANASPSSLRMAYASCQRWEDGYFAAYTQMLRDAPDLVVFLGDYIYEYATRMSRNTVRSHTLSHIRTLDDFRDRYALYRSDRLLQRMHAACPWLVTWDDHEVENNYAGLVSVEGTTDLPALRVAAYQAFYENMPIRRSAAMGGLDGILQGQPLQVYCAFDIGRLVRIHLLDNRQFRSQPACGEKPGRGLMSVCTSDSAPQRSMLGKEQEQWLEQSFAGAQARQIRWHVIAQQTRFSTAAYARGADGNRAADNWDGFPETRQRIIDALIRHKVRNPIVLGGDVHHNWVAHIHADPFDVSTPVVASEFCGTSISSNSARNQEEIERLKDRNPHCLFANAEKRGYGLVDFSPDRATVRLMAVENPGREDSVVGVLARFEVADGGNAVLWA